MGSISASLPGPTFNAQSSYASDLQTELDREVQIASLPIQQMQSDVAGWQSQQQALSSLQSAFSSLQTSIQAIGSSASGTLSASVSDPTVASATADSTALPGSYTIEVDHVGTSTTTLSNAGNPPVSDPSTGNITSTSSLTLSVDGTAYTITPAGNTLDDLAAAINSAGAGVQATIVNVGGATGADYRLAVTSSNVGATTIQLSDGTNNLLNTLSMGTDAEYSVDGSPPTQSSSNQITLAPGLTVNLLQPSSTSVTVSVGADYSGLSSALANFASAYNSAVMTVDQQIGQNAGPLSGQGIVYSLTNALNSLVNYTGGSGVVNALASLGLTLGQNGQLSFDSSAINNDNIASVQQFLGNVSTGGFLQAANNALSGVADPSNGAIQSEFNSLQTETTNENNLISNEEVRVTDLENNLTAELSQADSIIAELEQQKTYYTELFQAEYPASPKS